MITNSKVFTARNRRQYVSQQIVVVITNNQDFVYYHKNLQEAKIVNQ